MQGRCMLAILSLYTGGFADVVMSLIPDDGPDPGELAWFITSKLSGTGCRACYSTSPWFDDILEWIRTDLEIGDPVIALIAWGPFKMHYINVVAVSDENVAYMDTDNEVKYYSIGDFEDLMDCSSYSPHGLDTYNLIRFEKYA